MPTGSVKQRGCDKLQQDYLFSLLNMSIEEFLNLSYRNLEAITNIDKSNWSKYFNDRLSPNWNTIARAAKALKMEPHSLMEAIAIKRKQQLKKISV